MAIPYYCCLGALLFLCACEPSAEQRQTSIEHLIASGIDSLRANPPFDFAQITDKLTQIDALCTQGKPLDSLAWAAKPVTLPFCESSSGSCRYETDNLLLTIPKGYLTGEPVSKGYFSRYEAGSALMRIHYLQRGTYRPIYFQDSSPDYARRNMQADFNLLRLWQDVKWLVVLEVTQQTYPEHLHDGEGLIEGRLHILSWEPLQYHGYITVSSQNADRIYIPDYKEKTVEKRQYYGKRSTTRKETQREYLSDSQKLGYVRKDLEDNFKEAINNTLDCFFVNPKGEKLYGY